MRRYALSAMAVIASSCSVAAGLQEEASQVADPAHMGVGWRAERVDVDVTVLPDEERVEIDGTMTLRLDGLDESHGPTIGINWRTPVMRYERLEGPAAARIETNARIESYPDVTIAHLRFDEPLERGAKVELEFALRSEGRGFQFAATPHGALASWTEGWMPFAIPRIDLNEGATAKTISYPGETTLRLPAGWSGISDGELVSREETEAGVVERWRLEDRIARSFCAGPYEVATRHVDGRTIRVAMLPGEKAIGIDRLAELLGGALAAQEAKWGPLPFPAYGVVEIPSEIETNWYAASQQTFIMAQSRAFDWEHGNLPLWGHEMSHGWWGNTVAAGGPGSKWCSESLAQLGALIAIEAIEGEEAAREFLGYSRSGYSPAQCAMGYFWMWRQGKDKPIAELGPSADDHSLSDNKGYWIYHMLRGEVGDEVFFGVLRGLIRDFAGRDMTVEDVRSAFIAAAPGHELEAFFAQWLDRTGAPVLDVDWHGIDRGSGVQVTLKQAQEGEPFVFDLDIEVRMLDGSAHIETVRVDEPEERFEFAVPGRPESVRLDPDYKVLIYRPGYGPAPGSLDDPPAG